MVILCKESRLFRDRKIKAGDDLLTDFLATFIFHPKEAVVEENIQASASYLETLAVLLGNCL